MADVSACNGSDGSSLTVSGPRPLRGNEPRPITQTQALSPAPRADSAAVRTPNPNPGPRGPQSLPSEDHRTIKAHGRWTASGQEVMSHPSVTSKSHVTHTMTDNPITKCCHDNVSVSPECPGADTHTAGAHVLQDQSLLQQEVGYSISFISMLSVHIFLLLTQTELFYDTRTIFKSDLAINNFN